MPVQMHATQMTNGKGNEKAQVWVLYSYRINRTPTSSLPWPFRRNYGDIELLFQLLRAFTGRFLCNMTFLKEYMEEEIPKNYSIAQKRALFFRFVEFNDPNFGDELKAKVSPIVSRRWQPVWELFLGSWALFLMSRSS